METEDVKAIIDRIAELDWVAHNTNSSGAVVANDPVLGAIGGSYGGGYQTMTALDEIADEGATRFDALAPEITWYDLPESLAPQNVPRTLWDTLLYAAGASMLPTYVHEGQVWGTATGQWPDGTLYGQPVPGVPDLDAEFHKHSPVAFVEKGYQLNVPILERQGISDNLFNLNQGLNIFNKVLTDDARSQSFFVGYNGGHALPSALPPGTAAGSDACSPNGFTTLTIDFFHRVFAHEDTAGLLPARYNLTSADGSNCLRFDAVEDDTYTVDPLGTGTYVTPTGVGAPLNLEVADGPVTITGVPKLSGTVTALGLDNRAFFGLAVGTSPADAKLIQNNVMPLREPLPVVDGDFDIELPGISIEIPEGQKLFLTVSPVSDMFIGTGSKPPGGMVLSDLTLTTPHPAAGTTGLQASSLTLAVTGTGSKKALVATLTGEDGSPISDATVSFFGDGNALGSGTTDANGVASLPLESHYRGANHAFEARFDGNDSYSGSSGSTST
jgi:hypothetical protein